MPKQRIEIRNIRGVSSMIFPMDVIESRLISSFCLPLQVCERPGFLIETKHSPILRPS
jgi:hypothetical protein